MEEFGGVELDSQDTEKTEFPYQRWTFFRHRPGRKTVSLEMAKPAVISYLY